MYPYLSLHKFKLVILHNYIQNTHHVNEKQHWHFFIPYYTLLFISAQKGACSGCPELCFCIYRRWADGYADTPYCSRFTSFFPAGVCQSASLCGSYTDMDLTGPQPESNTRYDYAAICHFRSDHILLFPSMIIYDKICLFEDLILENDLYWHPWSGCLDIMRAYMMFVRAFKERLLPAST